MHVVVAIVITTLVAYPLGVLTAKWVLLEGESIKAHVSGEVDHVKAHVTAEIKTLREQLDFLKKI